ncbi:MAG: hypothetical protein QXG38_04285, partial [Candidatus Hadarchaeales archaeon]
MDKKTRIRNLGTCHALAKLPKKFRRKPLSGYNYIYAFQPLAGAVKKESALGLGLRLLGLALSLGPLLIAFSMHNWNIQETLIDTGGAGSAIGNIQNFLNMGNMGNLRPIQENATYDPATQTATLPLEISGIPFSLTVKEIS